MRGALLGYYSSDLQAEGKDPDLEKSGPDDLENFGLWVTAFVGPDAAASGEEMFDFFVCSPSWIAQHPPEKGFWFLRNHLLLTRWDVTVLDRALRDLCARTQGDTWQEIATKLSRWGRWEYENDSAAEVKRFRNGSGLR